MIDKLRILIFLPWSIYFNFYYFDFKTAIKLPVLFYVYPTFLRLKGEVIIDAPIKTGMIKLGKNIAPIESYSVFRWEVSGKIIFKGKSVISHHTFISCAKDAIIEFGNKSNFSYGTTIVSFKKIVFSDKVRVSWNSSFIDTDFHPLIDEISNKPIAMNSAIYIGYGCWIGYNTIIVKGSYLADNTTVSAGSVVHGKFKKSKTIIKGNPAIVVDEGYIRDDV